MIYSEETIVKHSTYNILTRGYHIFESYLSHEACEKLKTILDMELRSYNEIQNCQQSSLDKYQIHDLLCKHYDFLSLIDDQQLDNILSPLIGPYWVMYAATSSSIPPFGTNYANRIHNDCGRFSKDFIFNIGVIWALDEYTERNGGSLAVLPGSQHLESKPADNVFEEYKVNLYVPQGSLIVFNAYMYHRTSVNKTADWNHSMTLNACRPFMKQRLNWVELIPDHLSSRLSDRGRRVIGFDTRVPSSLTQFFVPLEERLYKPNQG